MKIVSPWLVAGKLSAEPENYGAPGLRPALMIVPELKS
jgi:hypothetical protein